MIPGIFSTKYKQDMALVRTKTQWFLLIVFLIFLFCIPLFAGSFMLSVLLYIGITIISVLGLHIVTGLGGLVSLGHAAFMGVGGYTAAILANRWDLPFFVTLPCAGVVAGLVGVVFGAPSLRIKGFYLAMATLAAQFIFVWGIYHGGDLTQEAVGMDLPLATLGGIIFDNDQKLYLLVFALTVLVTFLVYNISRTRIGRALIAIRDNDRAAQVMGVNLFRYKLLAFFIACFFAGIAGALWAYYLNYVHPDHFTLQESIWFLGMIIVGGMGSTLGAVLGTVAIKGLDILVDLVTPVLESIAPSILAGIIPYALGVIVFALVVAIFLMYEPRGLAHRWGIIKNYYRIWPYPY